MYRFCIIFISLCLVACGREPLIQTQSYVFGTLVDITIYGESDARSHALAQHINTLFQGMHQQLHAWQAGSEIDQLNQAIATGNPASVSPDVALMLNDVTQLSKQSKGLFNPAIGHLIQLWGFQRDEFTPVTPKPSDIERLVQANPQMSDLMIKDQQVTSSNNAVRVDLGGYAKGLALDRALAYLRAEKVHGALVNIGGNIIALGQHGDRPWRVGIQHPRQAGAIASLDLPDGWAIGTSGDYQRFFEQNGKRYCHIINPQTGRPAEGVEAVTVLITSGAKAGVISDVASKPLFISGVDGWREAAKTMGVGYALLVDDHGKVYLTQEMQKKLQWIGKQPDAEVVP